MISPGLLSVSLDNIYHYVAAREHGHRAMERVVLPDVQTWFGSRDGADIAKQVSLK
jgi:hypothetical protein